MDDRSAFSKAYVFLNCNNVSQTLKQAATFEHTSSKTFCALHLQLAFNVFSILFRLI
jgi:hypothetical protein